MIYLPYRVAKKCTQEIFRAVAQEVCKFALKTKTKFEIEIKVHMLTSAFRFLTY